MNANFVYQTKGTRLIRIREVRDQRKIGLRLLFSVHVIL
jgi:hypothetical protein